MRIFRQKIDCEWCEWFTWPEWITVDMRQILVETHNAPMPNARVSTPSSPILSSFSWAAPPGPSRTHPYSTFAQDFFFNLHDAGYVIFSKEANYENGAGCVEYAFVKLSTDFFLDGSSYSKRGLMPGVG